MTILEALPVIDEPTVNEGMIQLPEENKATTQEWLRSFYGELMNEELPLSDKVFQQIYEMSTETWKGYWQYWKEEGILK
jgi:ribonucleotide reductase beta subunit family protein with ferritin-like domain